MGETDIKPDKQGIIRFMFGVGVINILFIFLTFAIAQAGFVLNIPVSPYHLILAFALTILGAIILSYYSGQKKTADLIMAGAGLIVFMLLLVSCWAIADNFYDVSYDGQWYHQGAIHLMMNGFDPLYQQTPGNYSGGLYIGHYPLAFETASSVISSFTHHIEDGKLLNVFLMATSFLIIFPVIVFAFPGINRAFALVVALLAALNPVCIYQSLSFYVDGASASLLAILVFLLILAYKKPDRILLFVTTCVIVLAVNIKFFNLAYVAVLVVGFLAICLINRKSSRLHDLLILSLLIGILFGAHPYLTNLASHGTPFYPVDGISSDLIFKDIPANLAGKNSLEQLAVSLFSKSDFSKGDSVLKIPLTYADTEIHSFIMTDTRSGGFGPLFSAAVVLAILFAALILFLKRKDTNPLNNVLLPMCLLLLITVVINPASWWARYVPQLWLIPVLLLIDAWQRLTGKLRLLAYAMVLILALNVCVIAYSYYGYQLDITHKINQQITEIQSLTQNKPAMLYCGAFPAVQDRYRERGVNFILTDKPPDDDWSTLAQVEASYRQVTFY